MKQPPPPNTESYDEDSRKTKQETTTKKGGEIRPKQKIKLKNLQYEGSRWGRGIYKGKSSSGRQQQGQGHPGPMILSLGHDAPSRLPPQLAGPLHSRAHRLVTLFSLVCRAVHWPFEVRRGMWGPN